MTVLMEMAKEIAEDIRCIEGEITNIHAQIDRAANDCRNVINGNCCTLSKGLEGSYAACAARFARILIREEKALAELTDRAKAIAAWIEMKGDATDERSKVVPGPI